MPRMPRAAPFNPATQHGRRRPAAPIARLHDTHPFGHAAGHGQNQRHHHIGGIFGHHTGRVRHMDAPLTGGCHIDMVHTCAVSWRSASACHPPAQQSSRRSGSVIVRHQHIRTAASHRPVRSGSSACRHHAIRRRTSSFIRVSTTSGNRRVTTTLICLPGIQCTP